MEVETEGVSGDDTYQEKIIDELKAQLKQEQEKAASYEKKLQYLLADFENLKKRTELDVQNKVNSALDSMILKFLSMYDDFVRAKDALAKQKINTDGLSAILKNMDSFLLENGVTPIEAFGEIFNPQLHEAISVKEDPSLDDNTITAEIRKGYILQNRVIRPSLVEISKKNIIEL
ncbi:MAG: nucleotide exchange factor GrpE [Thaumarchaeota archaeon]|nr:nucleotide exchange factor GrpE [Nitrososphaerota archaeon]MBI3642168.1 nucleotide exchange factor GrpE [Nitrososphaerota archaeon]